MKTCYWSFLPLSLWRWEDADSGWLLIYDLSVVLVPSLINICMTGGMEGRLLTLSTPLSNPHVASWRVGVFNQLAESNKNNTLLSAGDYRPNLSLVKLRRRNSADSNMWHIRNVGKSR